MYAVTMGYTYQTKNKKVSVTPSVLLRKQQDFYAVMLSSAFRYKWMLTGIGYRFGDAVMVMMGLDLKKFRLNYSYDLTASKLTNATIGGVHEVSMRYLIK